MKAVTARIFGSLVTTTLIVIAPLTTAASADASSRRHCPSQRTVAKALKKTTRKALVRSSYHPNGVFEVKCSGSWATAIAEVGEPGFSNGKVVLLRRKHGRWHEVSRTKPCERHKVPRRIYARACLSG